MTVTDDPAAPTINFPTVPPTVDCVVTHGGCFDGFTSEWLLHRRWPDARYVAGHYGEAPPTPDGSPFETWDNSREPFGTLVIADFSYPPDVITKAADMWARIIMLDHHRTAVDQYDDADVPGNVTAVFDMARSGAGLVADWLGARSLFVSYIEDQDLYTHNLPASREHAAAVSGKFMTHDNWDRLEHRTGNDFERLIEDGRVVMGRDNVIVAELVAVARPMTIAGHTVLTAPSPYALGSLVGEALAKDVPFAAYYRDLPDRREFGLRSERGNPDRADVQEIAKTLGGGGHVTAAGFRVTADHPLATNWNGEDA